MFSITSYPAFRSREQEFREEFRQWSPAPAETAVTINGIRYERFESRTDGNTTVAFPPNTNSANERGYASVLIFVARDCNRFDTEDFEIVVSSFRYISAGSAATSPGEEIGSNSGDTTSDATSADTGISGGVSSGGGGCHRLRAGVSPSCTISSTRPLAFATSRAASIPVTVGLPRLTCSLPRGPATGVSLSAGWTFVSAL